MSCCDRCSNSGHCYIIIEHNVEIQESDCLKLDDKCNSISQCNTVTRKSADGLKAIVETCRSTTPNIADVKTITEVNYDSVTVTDKDGANTYIIANKTDFGEVE